MRIKEDKHEALRWRQCWHCYSQLMTSSLQLAFYETAYPPLSVIDQQAFICFREVFGNVAKEGWHQYVVWFRIELRRFKATVMVSSAYRQTCFVLWTWECGFTQQQQSSSVTSHPPGRSEFNLNHQTSSIPTLGSGICIVILRSSHRAFNLCEWKTEKFH